MLLWEDMLVGLIIDCGVQNADCRLDVDGGDSIVVGVGVCAGFDTGECFQCPARGRTRNRNGRTALTQSYPIPASN